MRSIDETREAFDENKQRQGDVAGAIQIKQRELLQLQGNQASTVAKNINKKNKENSIKVGRSLVADAAAELEELTAAKRLLEEEEIALGNELELSSLHQRVMTYKEQTEASYFSKTDLVLQILGELNGVLVRLDAATQDMRKGVSPNFTLEKLLTDIIDRGVSVSAFWDSGEVLPADKDRDNDFLSALRVKYKAPMAFFTESAGIPRYNDVLNTIASHWTLNQLDFIRQLKNKTTGTIGKFTGEVINHNTVVSMAEPNNRLQVLIANEKAKNLARRRAHRGIFDSK